jgi:light-regulated signal transduction histidine kinase (bacteriophytochrome)
LQALGNNIAVCIRNYELYEELQAVNSDLDARVQSRTSDLEMANKEMEEFTYTIAHDLRAPVRAIVTNAQMILEDYGEAIPEGAKALLDRQAAAAKRLSNMMDGLLALARIGKHETHIMQMNLSRLAEEVAMDAIRTHPEMPPGFDIEPNILIAADARLMRILLQNVYENSIKFTSEGTRPIVKVRTDPKDASISFVVEDNGIGFDMEYVDKIFQPFERLVRNEYPGTGIGLASVKRIVDKHRGHIQVKSCPGKGTTLEFRL